MSGSSQGAAVRDAEPPRVIVLWAPDWPVTAAAAAAQIGPDCAVALIAKGLVFASSAAARAEGVTRGLRLREAQARCPDVIVLNYDPALDNRAFEPVIAAVEELTPGVQLLRPGVCAVRVRGAAQYYGGEKAAALALSTRMAEVGASGTRAGIADGIFTADQAARAALANVRIIAAGESAAFLSPLDVGLLDDAALVTLLRRLGIRTLGGFAALSPDDVRTRFGEHGARLHALAAGRDSWPLTARTPPTDFDTSIDFEPALDRVDQVAFSVRAVAEEFIAALTATRLVCTAIRVQLESDGSVTPSRPDDSGKRPPEFSERVWLHPRSFTAADVVDRVRWQLQGSGVIDVGLSSGIARVRISPEAVDAIAHHETGLWGSGADERIHHGLSRVQSMLGHGAVLMPSIGGGRTLRDRQRLVAWGDRPVVGKSVIEPWPGRLPTPLPSTVFAQRHPVGVLAADGAAVQVDERAALSGAPVSLRSGARLVPLIAWTGPWPIAERWWSPKQARLAWRFQAVDDTGCAWLLVLDGTGWWAEARYD